MTILYYFQITGLYELGVVVSDYADETLQIKTTSSGSVEIRFNNVMIKYESYSICVTVPTYYMNKVQ